MSIDLNPITPDLVKQGMKSLGTFALGKTLGSGVVTVTLILGAASVAALSYASYKLLQQLGKGAIKVGKYSMDCRAARKDVKAFEASPRAQKTLEIFKLEKAIAKALPESLKKGSQNLAQVQRLYKIYKLRNGYSDLKLKNALDDAIQKKENAQNDFNEVNNEVETMRSDLSKIENSEKEISFEIEKLNEKLKTLEPSVPFENDSQTDERLNLEKKINELETKLKNLRTEYKIKNTALSSLEENLKEKTSALDKANSEFNKARAAYDDLKEKSAVVSFGDLEKALKVDWNCALKALNAARAVMPSLEKNLKDAEDAVKTAERKKDDAFKDWKSEKEPSKRDVKEQTYKDLTVAYDEKLASLKQAKDSLEKAQSVLSIEQKNFDKAQNDYDLASEAVSDPNISQFLLTDSTPVKSDLTQRFETLDKLYSELDKAAGDYSIPEARKLENIREELVWNSQKNVPDKLALDFEVEANKYGIKYGMTAVPGSPPSFKVFIQGAPDQIKAALNAFNKRTLGMTKPKALSASERVAVVVARQKGAMEHNQKLREALGPELTKTKAQSVSR